ncbi:tail terminator [Arthrobacter phage Niobe]|uniref:Tail terminator n=1 Tax=Arthrobacter phage Elezi TaxID=2762410 RepID=A0A7G8LGZ1_9CAUD|nr:tail terminator [Arthrobacter phage Elezi]QNJ56513.1 tail terminator [Arthrobacter phage Elezi]QOP64315.1 tail terminator [Arthrobacter phage London]UAJ15374.1 tail terminator [Arthrobacter phage Asa16]
MTDSTILFPDPQKAVVDVLKLVLMGRPEAVAQGVTVSTRPPKGTSPSLPYVQVRSDGRFRDARLNGRASVRIIVWHTDEGYGEELAGLCEALLLAATSPEIRGFSPLTGPMPTGDPDTGAPMSYFTLTARLRPVQI